MSVPAEAADPARLDVRHSQGVQVGSGNVMVNQFVLAAAGPGRPVLAGRPPLPADALQQRPGLRAAIEERLSHRRAVVLVGDGGTGKTQLAAAVLDGARDAGVHLAAWVPASSRTDVVAGYAQAYAALDPAGGGGAAPSAADAFLAWLATTDRSWMVVLDDVADPADLSGLWPAGRTGRVVATTRRRDAALAARGDVLEVGVWTPAESSAYLTAKLGRAGGLPPDALGEVDRLADDLGHLPLALAQAAAVVADEAITCATYRRLLADRGRRLSELFPPDPAASGDEYDRALAATWSLAADRADALSPAGLARPLLAVAALLDPHGIPEAVLTSGACRRYIGATSAEEARRAVRNLHRLSLVTHEPADPERSVRMHALAQRSTVEQLSADAYRDAIRSAADALVEAWPQVELDAELGQGLRAGAAALLGRHPPPAGPGAHPVVFHLGRSLGEAGLAADAAAHFAALADSLTRELGPDHPDTFTARQDLAHWRGEAGGYAAAAEAFDRLVADRTRVLGPDHPDTVLARASAAYWCGHAGDPLAAAAATEVVIADMIRVLGPDHGHTLSTRHNLAHWRGLAGDPAGAVAAYEGLLLDSLRVLGPDHFDTLDTRRNLAHWRGLAGDAAGAARELEAVAADYARAIGRDRTDAMFARDHLAYWRGRAGDPAGAAAAYAELLADRLRVLGPDHPHTLRTRLRLAEWRGDEPAHYRTLLADCRRVLGPDHPQTRETAAALSRVLANGD